MAQSAHSTSLLDTSSLADLRDARVGLVYTEWNDAIISELKNGCERILTHYNAVVTHKILVPGAFEIPFACRQLSENTEGKSGAPEAIIAFGTVIRGGTPHFDYVCKAVT